jgi:hypothetical protein
VFTSEIAENLHIVRTIIKNIAERQQAITFDLTFLSLKFMAQERLFLAPLALLDCLLLPLAARSARYRSSGSTPTNGRFEPRVTGKGRLIVLCMSRRLCDVIGLEVRSVWAGEGGSADAAELGVDNVAGAVVVRKRCGNVMLVDEESWGDNSSRGVFRPSDVVVLSTTEVPAKS